MCWGTLLYPVIIAVGFYTQWLSSWYVLGHCPVPMLDDPKDIPSTAWLFVINGLLLASAPPMALVTMAVHVGYLAAVSPLPARKSCRSIVAGLLWVGLIVLFRFDPGSVMEWWFD